MREAKDGNDGGTAPERRDEEEVADERAVVCAACRHALTTRRARVEVDGKHVHTFVNPSGIEFVVACFEDAPGARSVGAWEDFWTWFPGHAWRIALCGRCGAHVGWAFARAASGARAFFALVLDRVRGA